MHGALISRACTSIIVHPPRQPGSPSMSCNNYSIHSMVGEIFPGERIKILQMYRVQLVR